MFQRVGASMIKNAADTTAAVLADGKGGGG